nr:SulP family inorganic anion transporter [Brucepastera parasyntrophica]
MKPELFKSLKAYSVKTFISDFIAGVIVGIVALPLSIAFGIASGVSPAQGIFTAIIAGFIISVFGGCSVQIGGPTGAFVVLVYSIVRQFGYEGLAVAGIMAGIFLVVFGLLKFGVFIKFIPYTIVTGFTAGIALVIFSGQIPDLFGLTVQDIPGDFIGKLGAYWNARGSLNLYALAVAVCSILVIIFWPRINRKIPGSLIAIILATLVVQIFKIPVETIGSRFGSIPTVLPAPRLPVFSLELILNVLPSALSIALLAAIESLLSAVVADEMTGDKHDPNMELVAQGLANIASPFLPVSRQQALSPGPQQI